MSTFRRITKLKVNIANGETVLSYDDATKKRQTNNRNCGFWAADSWTSIAESQTAKYKPRVGYSILEVNSGTSLRAADTNRVADNETEKPQADSAEPSELVDTSNDKVRTNSSDSVDVCMMEGTSTTSAAKLDNLPQSDSDFTELEYDVDTTCSTATSQDDSDLPAVRLSDADLLQSLAYANTCLRLTKLLTRAPVSGWTLVKSVMPELLKTDDDDDGDNGDDDVSALEAACEEQLRAAYQPLRFVTWHLSTCLLKDEVCLPICPCLKIKTSLSQLRSGLDSFLQMPVVHRQAENYASGLAQFSQALLDLRSHMQQLHKLLMQHVMCNKLWHEAQQQQMPTATADHTHTAATD